MNNPDLYKKVYTVCKAVEASNYSRNLLSTLVAVAYHKANVHVHPRVLLDNISPCGTITPDQPALIPVKIKYNRTCDLIKELSNGCDKDSPYYISDMGLAGLMGIDLRILHSFKDDELSILFVNILTEYIQHLDDRGSKP